MKNYTIITFYTRRLHTSLEWVKYCNLPSKKIEPILTNFEWNKKLWNLDLSQLWPKIMIYIIFVYRRL